MGEKLEGYKVYVNGKEIGTVKNITFEKPPLGITPRKFWIEHRMEHIIDAMNRFLQAGKEIPVKWVEEYNELIQMHKKG